MWSWQKKFESNLGMPRVENLMRKSEFFKIPSHLVLTRIRNFHGAFDANKIPFIHFSLLFHFKWPLVDKKISLDYSFIRMSEIGFWIRDRDRDRDRIISRNRDRDRDRDRDRIISRDRDRDRDRKMYRERDCRADEFLNQSASIFLRRYEKLQYQKRVLLFSNRIHAALIIH